MDTLEKNLDARMSAEKVIDVLGLDKYPDEHIKDMARELRNIDFVAWGVFRERPQDATGSMNARSL